MKVRSGRLKFRMGEEIYLGILPDYIFYPMYYLFGLDTSYYKIL